MTPAAQETNIESLNKSVEVKLHDILDVKLEKIEKGYAVAKKGNLKVIIRENQESDFTWGQSLLQ